MLSTTSQTTVSQCLLAEVASSGIFPDPALFVYGVLGACVVGSLCLGYLLFGRLSQEVTSAGAPVGAGRG